ncbi:ATPase, P-type (transporting), HAD superfamily, subfamily IC [Loktanella fryxellensis]|uniref:ATPase, P-type (Transporting), HAD superfamily, subfamily IC n=1 Tax=Loktanella fryxellensis TaxID=245187 RepID=A0A1H8JAY3_9RHOB|nr:ATPase, P-type (transporting), HAD superfamily, subfamily IC [Loktanella fryxellensis]
MFTTATVALLATVLLVRSIALGGDAAFEGQIVFWHWLTVLFGNFAEALAEGCGKAQAASLRSTKAELTDKRLKGDAVKVVPARELRAGDTVLVETGDQIPADGEVVDGVAFVNEAAITGEPAPVIASLVATALPRRRSRASSRTGSRSASRWNRARGSSTG